MEAKPTIDVSCSVRVSVAELERLNDEQRKAFLAGIGQVVAAYGTRDTAAIEQMRRALPESDAEAMCSTDAREELLAKAK